jgi:DNA-binding GntR family transcriptional regulator
VREALSRLAAMGVIELRPDRGAHIRMLGLDDAIDILVVMQGLVGMAARIAAQRIERAGAAKRLKEALADIETSNRSSGSAAYATAPDEFYKALFDIAGNAELTRLHPSLQVHLVRIQFRSIMRTVDRRDHGDYRQIAEAVLSGRSAAADSALRTHIGRFISALENYKQGHVRAE